MANTRGIIMATLRYAIADRCTDTLTYSTPPLASREVLSDIIQIYQKDVGIKAT